MIDLVAPTCMLCEKCEAVDECPLVEILAQATCTAFNDGYEGPVNYPDGDAKREWVRVVIFREEPYDAP